MALRIMADMVEKLKALLTPTIQALGFELWGLTYGSQGRASVLCIFVEGPNGVTIDDCARISRQCSSVLDVEALIHGSYTLEVSSPGMDRQFFEPEQYARYKGEIIKLKLHQARQQRKQFKGVLLEVSPDSVMIEVDGQPMVVAFQDIERGNKVG